MHIVAGSDARYLHKKEKLMMTREEVLSIEEYCAEHKISHKKRLEELEIPFWNFYKAKQKYRKEDEQDAQLGQFVPLSSGRFVPPTMPPARTAGKSGKPVKPSEAKSYKAFDIPRFNEVKTITN